MNHSFHRWLRHALPATTDELVSDLAKLHKALPKSYEGLPNGEAAVREALQELADGGLLRKEFAEWQWVGEKVTEQKELFA